MKTPQGSDEDGTVSFHVGSSTFRALPTRGARLMDWNIRFGTDQTRTVIHWPEDADMANLAKVRGGNPVLFPFAGRCFHKGVENRWKPKGSNVLPMPRHGFARTGNFETLELHSNGFCARLVPDEAARDAYPFNYEFRVRYQFEELALRVTFELENRDDKPLPWAPGHHFYFRLPWHSQALRKDYELSLDARRAAYHAPDGALVPDKEKHCGTHFGDPVLIERIHTHLKSSLVEFGPRGGEENVQIRLHNDPRPPSWMAVVTWTESEDSPFYCVEPWMAPPNAPEHGKGLCFVNPGDTEAWTVEVTLF